MSELSPLDLDNRLAACDIHGLLVQTQTVIGQNFGQLHKPIGSTDSLASTFPHFRELDGIAFLFNPFHLMRENGPQ